MNFGALAAFPGRFGFRFCHSLGVVLACESQAWRNVQGSSEGSQS